MIANRIAILFAVAVLVGGATVARGQDVRSCSNASIRGAWGYTETGNVLAPTGATVLAAAVGRYDFGSNGSFTGDQHSATSTAGVSHDTKTGAYTLNPDCTGTLDLYVYNDAGDVQRHSYWSFVIVDNGQEMRAIMTSMALPNGVPLTPIMTMTARKLFPGRADAQQ